MLLERQLNIIIFLFNSNQWVTSEELSIHFNLNKKTIQNDIKEISNFFSSDLKINVSKSKGYYIEFISKEAKKVIITELNERVSKNSLLPRHSSIVLYLLFLKNYITMQDLADRFYMSKTAIALEIEIIKRWMERYEGIDLEINKKYGIIIHGDEGKKRSYCSKNGTLYAFKTLPFPDEMIKEYENHFVIIREIISDSCLKFEYIVTGEELEKITRFITVSIIRTRMGYIRESETEFKVNSLITYDIAEHVREQLNHHFTFRELKDIEILLSESDTLGSRKETSPSTMEKVHLFTQEIAKEIGIVESHLKIDYLQLANHIEKMILRNNSGDVAINHYNEEIILQYPLETHLTYQFLGNIFSMKINKESSFVALFLSTYFRQYKNRSKVLLVSDQNISIGQYINSLFEKNESFQISEFSMMPTYQFKSKPEVKYEFDFLLTTNPEVILLDNSFYFLSPIVDISNIYTSLRKRLLDDNEKRKEIIKKNCVKEHFLTKEDSDYPFLLELIQNGNTATHHTFSKINLYICQLTDTNPNQINIYNLNEPVLFKHKKIKRIIDVRFNKKDPSIFLFFSTVSDILNYYA